VLAGWLAGVVWFGMWLSVRCATRERAVGWFLGLALAACVLMPLLGRVLVRTVDGPADLMLAFTLRGLSPFVSLWDATPMAWDWQTSGVERFRFQGAVAASVLVGVLGVVFGVRAVRKFERDGGGRSA
jgi:hypothetical protein